MSQTLERSQVETTGLMRGKNLVTLAKPYFGLIVLTTGLLTLYGVY
jgi:hypothetical protein